MTPASGSASPRSGRRRWSPAPACPSGSTWSSRRSGRPPSTTRSSAARRRRGSSSPGTTAGHLATVDLRRVFAFRLEIIGSSMGTPDELAALLDLVANETVKPVIDSVLGVQRGAGGVRAPPGRADLRQGGARPHPLTAHARAPCHRRARYRGTLLTSAGAYSSSSSRRASQVANRSTGVSNSGFRSMKSRSRSASHSIVTVSGPRRSTSSSMPRSVKYTPPPLLPKIPVIMMSAS